MKKSLLLGLIIAIPLTAFVCYKFGPRNAAPNAQDVPVQATAQVADSTPAPAAPETPVVAADTSNMVASDSSPSNGLITLQFRPTVASRLPRAEDAKKAWDMNVQVMKQMGTQTQAQSN